MSDESETNTQSKPKSDALKLIVRRGEALVKLLNSPFNLADSPESIEQNGQINGSWDFLFKQIIDPQNQRIQRRNIPEAIGGFAWDPLLAQQVDPETLKDNKDLNYTCMTSTTLLPLDGKMSLFGGGGVGLLFDIRLCDLKGEKFVFAEDACTDNDWWHNPNAKSFHQNFQSHTINELRERTGLLNPAKKAREYNEVQAGINAKSLVAISLQPIGESHVTKSEKYYQDRFNAIYRKLYVASLMDRHLPIIILDPKNGPSEYTIEEQQNDLLEYLRMHPANRLCQALYQQNLSLIQAIPVEQNEKQAPHLAKKDLAEIKKIEGCLLEKIRVVGDQALVLKEILGIQKRVDKADSADELTLLNRRLKRLNERYDQLEALKITIDSNLANLNYDSKNHTHLAGFLQDQLDVLAEISKNEDNTYLDNQIKKYRIACDKFKLGLLKKEQTPAVQAQITVIEQLGMILSKTNAVGTNTRSVLEEFHAKLKENSSLLKAEKDPLLLKFAKSLGLVAVTILTLGAATKYAYQLLFNQNNSEAKEFSAETLEQPSPTPGKAGA